MFVSKHRGIRWHVDQPTDKVEIYVMSDFCDKHKYQVYLNSFIVCERV